MDVELPSGPISRYTARANIWIHCGLISEYTAETVGYHHEEKLDNSLKTDEYYVRFSCFCCTLRNWIYSKGISSKPIS